jgi:DNA polymerase
VICTLGRFATKLLADTELSMTAIHGKAKQRAIAGVEVLVFPVFHPAAALYTPSNRQVLEQDFAKLRYLLEHGLGSTADEVAAGACEGASSPGAANEGTPAGAPSKSRPTTSTRVEQLPLW